MDFTTKKIIVFDLDGTLAESKQSLDPEMSDLLGKLLSVKLVAIITGGGFPQLQEQVVSELNIDNEKLKKLHLFPTKGAMMYNFDGYKWNLIYEKPLTQEDKDKITTAFNKVYTEIDLLPKEHYGDLLEDRGSQFTFSAIGQKAPVEIKRYWDENATKRLEIKKHLDQYLPEFAVEIGGSTSIDITQKSVDKAYAIEKICEYYNLSKEEILFIGDAIFEGGNDYSIVKTSVSYINVSNYNETKDIIRKIINTN